MALLESVRVRGYRSARDVELRLGPVTALVGEARSGKSNLLGAIRALLDPAAPPPERLDLRGRARELSVEGHLSDGRVLRLTVHPPSPPEANRGGAPPVLLLSAVHRSGPLLEPDGPSEAEDEAVRRFRAALDEPSARRSDSAGASALVSGIDACHEARITGVVFLIEEPELFLRPHTQRYLYRRCVRSPRRGNQVALLDPRARVPQRRPPGRAGARPLQRSARDARSSSRSPSRPTRPSASSASSTPSGASSSSPARRSSSRAGRRSSSCRRLRARSATTPTGRRSRSSSAAASRTSRSSRASARRAAFPSSSSTTATRRAGEADPRRGRAQRV